MPQNHDHDYTPKGPQYSEEDYKGMAWLILLLAPFMLITSCFKLACPSESRAAQTVYSVSSPESPPPSPPADL